MKEIGSEFWLEERKIKHYEVQNDSKKMFLLSGRTAIDCALQLIEKSQKVNKVYFPSYCCQSMIDPFIERGVEIEFYTVKFKNGNLAYDIDCNKECSIFFAMNYFGFSEYNMDYYIEKFKKRNICVIEDATHSILSNRKYNEKSDFVVASLRKWFPIICGGVFINNSGKHLDIKQLQDNNDYIKLKEHAMMEKKMYIANEKQGNKEKFLKEFAKTEQILNEDYKNYNMDYKSYDILKNMDIKETINKRRRNVEVVYEYLRNQNKIEYLENINLEEDTPLFVPIFLINQKRNELKMKLIQNNIYFANHWEIPKQLKEKFPKEIYNLELSLICDQRYSTIDIAYYINIIENIL